MNAAIPRKAFAQMNFLSVYDLLELMRAGILLYTRKDCLPIGNTPFMVVPFSRLWDM